MGKLRFTKTDEFDAVCEVAPGHTITRSVEWFRLGGEQFNFRCTCGWSKKNPFGRGKSNDAANAHAASLIVRLQESK